MQVLVGHLVELWLLFRISFGKGDQLICGENSLVGQQQKQGDQGRGFWNNSGQRVQWFKIRVEEKEREGVRQLYLYIYVALNKEESESQMKQQLRTRATKRKEMLLTEMGKTGR